jgi:hypothetical protein
VLMVAVAVVWEKRWQVEVDATGEEREGDQAMESSSRRVSRIEREMAGLGFDFFRE